MVLRPQSLSTGRVRPQRLLETHLARVLFSAQRDRRTGVLTVDEGPVETQLHLSKGQVVYASRGPLGETLGRVLMREGVLDRSEYMVILERMAQPSVRDEVLRFGEVAIQLGMLAASELHDALALQVRHKLMHCFRIDEAVWTWLDGESPRSGPPFITPLEGALRRGLRDDPQGYRWTGLLLARRNELVSLAASPEDLAARFGASAVELRLLKRAQNRPLSVLLSTQTLEPGETAALILSLYLSDQLALRPATLDGPSTVDASKTKERRRRRTLETVEKRTKKAAHAVSVEGIQERAEEAASALRDEMQRRGAAAPSTQRGRVDAERAMLDGKALLERGKLAAAEERFTLANQLLPEAAEYLVYRRWCRYQLEHDPEVKTAVRASLRTALLEALRQDRRLAFAHYAHARLREEDGDDEAAERAYDIAGRLDSDLKDAKRRARLLAKRREES